MNLHPTRRAACSFLTLAISLAFAGWSHGDTNLIQNGDFSDNASSYSAATGVYGYDGNDGNPSAPTDWTPYGGVGIRDYANDSNPFPFGPADNDIDGTSATVTIYAFIQGNGLPAVPFTSTLSQSFHVMAGQEYELTYDAAPRQDGTSDNHDDIIATVSYNALPTDVLFAQTGTLNGEEFMSNDTAYDAGSDYGFTNSGDTFIATTSGDVTLTFSSAEGDSGNDDFTADVANVSVEDISPPSVPEPSTWAMLGAGILVLFGLRRWQKA